ncbi:MAG: response regulator transcription factor [Pyrinomonadaceae bacterium]
MLIIAASPVVRAGLETLVAGDNRFTVVGSAAAAPQPEVESGSADVILMEVERQTENALEALYGSVDEAPEKSSAIVLLASDAQLGDWAADALRSGASAVLPRTAREDEILAAIEGAASGLVVLPRQILDSMLANDRSSVELPLGERGGYAERLVEDLTPREAEVLKMLGEGLGNKTIAYQLGISEHTVKFHVASIFGKLGASSRTEAVTQGLRQGLIML